MGHPLPPIRPGFARRFFISRCLALFVVCGGISFGLASDDLKNQKPDGGEWRSLLDEKLSAWEIWMGVPHPGVTRLPEGTPTSTDGRTGTPMGLGNDPKHVFTVSMESGEPVLHVTGEIWGGLTTRESFTNYHLRVDVKWGERKWEPRLNLARNSGLLYHDTGPHGAFWSTWKRSLEFEIQEKDFGDLFPLGGTRADVAVKRPAKVWIYDPSGEVLTIGAGAKMAGGNRAAHLAGNFEKPHGEWNSLELYAFGNTAVHVVNGRVVNVIRNLAVLEGKPATTNQLEGGQLQLQSESAEVFYRRVQIQPITEFPAEIKTALELSPVVSILTGGTPGERASHGLEKIIAALRDQHISFEQINSPDEARTKTLIVAGLATDRKIFSNLPLEKFRQSVPTNAESLAIQMSNDKGRQIVAIAGSDNRGLMYAELEVADRIRWSTDAESPLSEVRDTVEKPSVGTRGITLFAMNRAYWESRFYDEAYWSRYLDTLAQNRFNLMVVILGYENGGFLAPSYPYFFDVPEFPEVKMTGITAAQQKQNTGALNRLIAMAHARGINFTIGLWDHIYRGNVQNGGSALGNDGLRGPTPSLVWGMDATNLIPYTQAALKTFLKTFPAIDGIQFRLHDESGLKASEQGKFWKSIFQTIMAAAPKLPLDLRAKGLTAGEIQAALDAGVNFHLSTKYWMEQMGLPFHPLHINPRDQPNRRHSYADLLVYPQKYRMNWQLWNGGTARIFLWGDPGYTRRFIKTTDLYDGDSFEVDEPLATKMEGQFHDTKPFDLLKPSARYYDYEFERYWHFFQVFGRIGYNINAPSEIWDKEFEIRFGAEAGPVLEKALHRASWILPRIIASSYPYGGFPMTAGWPEKQHLGDLPGFAKGTLSDVQLFENFDEEAQLLIEKGETAKVRPQETSRWFAQTAAEIEAQIADAEKRIGSRRSQEYDSTVMDLKMLASLARYHSQRISAAVSYRLFDRAKDPAALADAIGYERAAIVAWQQMVDAAGDTYAGDLMFGARSRNLCGHWKDELASLESGLATLQAQRNGLATNGVFMPSPRYLARTNNSDAPTVFHQPILTAPALKPLMIRAKVNSPTGIKWVQVLYRSVNQTTDYETLVMKPVDAEGNYEAAIPADKIDPQFDFMYFIQAMDNQHRGVMFPDFNKETPYFIVRLQRLAMNFPSR